MPDTTKCEHCGEPVEQPTTGRRRRYCGDQCKRRAFKSRHATVVDEDPAPEVMEDEEATPTVLEDGDPAPEVLEDEELMAAVPENEDAAPPLAEGEVELESMDPEELRTLAAELGLPTDGTEGKLMDRIEAFCAEQDEAGRAPTENAKPKRPKWLPEPKKEKPETAVMKRRRLQASRNARHRKTMADRQVW